MKFIILLSAILSVKSSDLRYEWQVDALIACPCGLISMWYQSLALLPRYYQLCDGTNGTPDLRDRFVLGAGLTYDFGATGGTKYISIGIDHLPSHKHEFKQVYTTEDGAHTHVHQLATTTTGAHTHGVSVTTDAAGGHYHGWQGATTPENAHYHSIPQRTTDAQGYHNHIMNAFIDDDYATNKVTGIRAEAILDGDNALKDITATYPDKTVIDYTDFNGQHYHTVPPDNTGAGSAHSHDVTGQVSPVPDHTHTAYGTAASEGDHYHGVEGTISGGSHKHSISGYTEAIGYNKPIYYLPPYFAVYFICCVRDYPSPVPAPIPSYPAPVPSYTAPVPSYGGSSGYPGNAGSGYGGYRYDEGGSYRSPYGYGRYGGYSRYGASKNKNE